MVYLRGMKPLLYNLLFGFIYLLSLLPFRVLHLFSNVFYVLVYHLIGYRKRIVAENLRRSFPEKSERERMRIAHTFYRHFCDLMIESVKSASMTQKDFNKRYHVKDWDVLFERMYAGKSIFLLSPHTGNWEWVFSLVDYLPVRTYAVYQPLRNPYFDRYIKKSRQRYRATLIPMKKTKEYIVGDYEANVQTLTWFAADQACHPDKAHWATFLHQDTTFHKGYERLARQTHQAVLFLDIRRTKRSHYELELIPICEDASQVSKGYIVQEFIRLTEQRVRAQPPYWLWSHKRWKHTRQQGGQTSTFLSETSK